MALNLVPRLPSLSVLAAVDNVCRIDLTVLFPDCASIEIGIPPEQPHSVDVQPSTIYVTVTPPTVTVPPRGEHPYGPGAGGPGGPDGHPHWPVTATTTCDEDGQVVTAMPIPTRPPFGGPGGPGGNNGPGGPGSGGPGSSNNGPGNGNNGPGNGGPGNGGPNGPGNGNNGPGNGNNGPGNGGPGNGNGNNNGGRPTTTLATVTRPSVPSSTATSCPLPPFLSISTSLTDLLDLDLKLYLDLSSITSGVGNLLDSVLPGLGSTVTNLLGANNQPASATNLPTTQRSRFRTLPCGTSLGSLPGGQTGTVPIDDGDNNGDDNNDNGIGNNNGGSGPTSAIEECIKRCEQDAIRASLELMTLRDCLGVTVDRRTTVDNCLWFVGPSGEKLPVLDLGVAVDLNGLLGPGGAEGVESAVRDVEDVTDATEGVAEGDAQ